VATAIIQRPDLDRRQDNRPAPEPVGLSAVSCQGAVSAIRRRAA